MGAEGSAPPRRLLAYPATAPGTLVMVRRGGIGGGGRSLGLGLLGAAGVCSGGYHDGRELYAEATLLRTDAR